jgi:hypothetical protein
MASLVCRLCMESINSIKCPLKGDTIQYMYTDSQHNNPLCRVVPIEKILSMVE